MQSGSHNYRPQSTRRKDEVSVVELVLFALAFVFIFTIAVRSQGVKPRETINVEQLSSR